MAIAVDSAGTVQTQAAAASLTFAHTCTGSTRCLVVAIGIVGPVQCSTVTYNSVSMTRAVRQQSPASSDGQSEIWYLAGPATGANNVVITWDFALDGSKCAQAVSFTGVDQAVPIANADGVGLGSTGSLDGTSSSIDIATASGNLVFDCMVLGTSSAEAPTVGAGQTQRGSGGAAGLFLATSTEPGVPAMTNMAWSWVTNTCRRQTGLSIRQFEDISSLLARLSPVKADA